MFESPRIVFVVNSLARCQFYIDIVSACERSRLLLYTNKILALMRHLFVE